MGLQYFLLIHHNEIHVDSIVLKDYVDDLNSGCKSYFCNSSDVIIVLMYLIEKLFKPFISEQASVLFESEFPHITATHL